MSEITIEAPAPTSPVYTQDWFTNNIPMWTKLLAGKGLEMVAEVGCFEGRATSWLLEHAMGVPSTIFGIDTFEGGQEHTPAMLEGVEARFHANTALAARNGQQVRLLKKPSIAALIHLGMFYHGRFDLVYIDGSHVAADVLGDAVLSYHLLAPGGLLIFDDYLWGANRPLQDRPKAAIDAFTQLWPVKVIAVGNQMVVRKPE